MYAHSYVLVKILLTLSAHFPEKIVDQWLSDAEVIECTEDKIVLYSPSPDNLRNLREQGYPHILELAKNLLQCNAMVEICGPEEYEKYKRSQIAKHSYLKPQFSFSGFVVGSSNEMAVKIAKTVALDPGNNLHNPLYVYGPSGVGKTHLLCAIANEIYTTKHEANICYVNADKFVGELIWGLQNGTYNDFRTKYRSIDVLIVEDIQFLAGKTTTQEELYYLFDYLYQNNKQLIFSANSYPSAIAGMETYLYSKFEQGIVIGIEAPDFQVRKEIVTRLDQTHKLGLCSEAILFVVEALPDNVRKIVGAMKRLRAARDIDGATLTLEQVKIIINQLV